MAYTQSATYYDVIYAHKDYARETQRLRQIVAQYGGGDGCTLLDVACGTGQHIAHLRAHFDVMGLDITPELLAVARERCPDVAFVQGDMVDFALDARFDVITCLFGSIGYVLTEDRLRAAVGNMARYLNPGGVLIVDPWLTPETWKPNTAHMFTVDEPEFKFVRVTVSEQFGHVSRNDIHFVVATPDGVQHFVERHELGLFTHSEYMAAFAAAGLDTVHDPEGLIGRGLYLGVHP